MNPKRKCVDCEATTNKPLSDFHEIGWRAYSLNREKANCYCPKHKHHMVFDSSKRFKESDKL